MSHYHTYKLHVARGTRRRPPPTPHTQFANKQTSSTTPGLNVKFLVSWTVKQDRACSTPTGAFLRGQARSGDLGLRKKQGSAAPWQNRPAVMTTSALLLLQTRAGVLHATHTLPSGPQSLRVVRLSYPFAFPPPPQHTHVQWVCLLKCWMQTRNAECAVEDRSQRRADRETETERGGRSLRQADTPNHTPQMNG